MGDLARIWHEAPSVMLEPMASSSKKIGAGQALSDRERVTGIEPALSAWEALAGASLLTWVSAGPPHSVTGTPGMTAVAPGFLSDLARQWHGPWPSQGSGRRLPLRAAALRYSNEWDSGSHDTALVSGGDGSNGGATGLATKSVRV
jgi:hypothetical protein